jgi:5-formyltetrahydrofolate cyclo-ligase
MAARRAPANNFNWNIKPTFNVRFNSSMTGDSRIPRPSPGLPDSTASEAAHSRTPRRPRRRCARRSGRARGARPGRKRPVGCAHRRPGAGLVAHAPDGTVGRLLAAARRTRPARGLCRTGAAGVRLALPVVVERDAALAFTEWKLGEPMLGRDGGGGAGHAALRSSARRRCWCPAWASTRTATGWAMAAATTTARWRCAASAHLGIAYSNQEAQFGHGPHDCRWM